jgi:Protein of unknown function (DUF2997)
MGQIRILARPDGTVQVTANGIPGAACKDATAPYEKAMGQVTDDRPTHELFAQQTSTGQIAQQG